MSLTLTNESGDFLINYKHFLPCGSVVNYAGSTAPTGWLICDGTAISRTTYSALFDIIGTTYGYTDGTNFKLPDLQNRVPVGKTNLTSLGSTGGNTDISLNVSQLPSHTHSGTVDASGAHSHTINDPGHNHSYIDAYFAENIADADISNNVFGTNSSSDTDNEYYYRPSPTTSSAYTGISVNSAESHSHGITIGNTGSGATFNIRNPYIVLNYIIKY